MTLEKLKEELDKRNIPYEEEKTKKEYNEKINIGELGDMVVFNIIEELEKERKKNKELEEAMEQLKEYVEYSLNNPFADERMILEMVLAKIKVELKGDNK